MRVEDVHVVRAQPAQALIQTGEQILAGSPVPIWSWPHGIAGLAREDQLVPVRRQVGRQDPPQGVFRRARGRPVVVGQIEMGDAEVEGVEEQPAHALEGRALPEAVPQAQRDGGEPEPAAAAAAIDHGLVAIGGGLVGHERLLVQRKGKAWPMERPEGIRLGAAGQSLAGRRMPLAGVASMDGLFLMIASRWL
jgi:hypothetical protein